MPLYEYRCAKCGERIEVIQSFSDKPLSKHAGCGGKLEKLISRSGFVLKGSGWYQTDYKAGSSSSSGESESDAPKSTDDGAKDAKPAPKKPAKKGKARSKG